MNGSILETVCVIPARGGSKGIPGKNIKLLVGRPLIAWTISAALNANSVDRVIVSTDSAEIASAAIAEGAEVIMRPDNLALDTSPSEPALVHALKHLHATENYDPDLLIFLQCTSPLTRSGDIDAAVRLHQQRNADTVLSAVAGHPFLWRMNNEGFAEAVNHDPGSRLRRQDIEPQFLESGAIYVLRAREFRKHGRRYSGKIIPYEMTEETVCDIDTPADFIDVERRLIERLRLEVRTNLPQTVSAIVFDFDGVFTDNRFELDSLGNERVFCSRGDGIGIKNLQKAGYEIAVISGESHPVVTERCRKLGIAEILQNISDKGSVLVQWSDEKGIPLEEIIYLGNDTNDLECLQMAGCGVVVADAHPNAIAVCDLMLSQGGGHGAIRELSDILVSRGRNDLDHFYAKNLK